MTDRYRIIDTPWPSERSLLSSDGHDDRGKALVAVDQYSAIEFREETGKIFPGIPQVRSFVEGERAKKALG